MKPRRILTAIALFASAGVALGQTPETITFKFDYKPGRVTRQKMVGRTVGAVRMPGPLPEYKMTQSFENVVTARCLSVNPDGSAVFELGLGDMAIKMSLGAMTFQVDSRAEADQPTTGPMDEMAAVLRQLLQGMSRVRFKATMSANGQPIKVEGLSAATNELAESLKSEGRHGRQIQAMLKGMSSMFDDKAMLQQMQMQTRIIPSKPVRVGDTWESSWESTIPMLEVQVKGKGEYELVGIETLHNRSCAKIRIRETLEMTGDIKNIGPSAGPLAGLLSGMRISSSGGEGVAYLDYQTGDLVQLRQAQNMVITMEMKAPSAPGQESGAAAEPVKLEQNLRQTLSVELLVDDPATQPSAR